MHWENAERQSVASEGQRNANARAYKRALGIADATLPPARHLKHVTAI